MLGNRIKEMRLQKGITQEQLAQHLNVAKSTIGMWENNKREPDVSMLNKISFFFNCSLDKLLGDEVQLEGGYCETEPEILCPICGYNFIHFLKTISIDYKSKKSGGIALQFECESEHLFYIVIENYKGNCYMVYTDEDFNYICSVNQEGTLLSSADKKYHMLDRYGKDVVKTIIDLEFKRTSEQNKKIINLPLSVQKVSAGVGNWLDEEEYTERINVYDTLDSRKANIVITVSGDSMEPMYSDGDKVLVKIQPDVEPGEIGIFIVANEGYIKKKGDHELISINPEYDNIPINEYTDYRCFGKVLGKAEILE